MSRIELLAEWLAAVVDAGRLVPGELVPALLDAGRRQPAIRALIATAAGPRAAWLAAQRADWAYLRADADTRGTATDDAVWELGSIGQRVRYLTALRADDPARARRLLTEGWDAESVDDRAALLATLATGLDRADEPLLEVALADRRKEVRSVAVDLLTALPGSGYAQRMTERATACVDTWSTDRILVRPPVARDRSMRADGLNARPPAGVGERAWLLEEIVARTPLTVWPGPPEAFLRRPMTEGWQLVVHRGLARAAVATRDIGWAEALVTVLTRQVRSGRRPDDRLLLEALYGVLPAERLAARAADLLAEGLVQASTVGVDHVLELCPRPWPPVLTEAFLDAFADAVGARTAGWRVTGLCEVAALRLPAGAADRVAAVAERARNERPADSVTSVADRLTVALRYRERMLAELSSVEGP